jgi:hypothetical protein
VGGESGPEFPDVPSQLVLGDDEQRGAEAFGQLHGVAALDVQPAVDGAEAFVYPGITQGKALLSMGNTRTDME